MFVQFSGQDMHHFATYSLKDLKAHQSGQFKYVYKYYKFQWNEE